MDDSDILIAVVVAKLYNSAKLSSYYIQRHHFSKRIGSLKILLVSKFLHSKWENISSGTSLVNDATAVYNFLTQLSIFFEFADETSAYEIPFKLLIIQFLGIYHH